MKFPLTWAALGVSSTLAACGASSVTTDERAVDVPDVARVTDGAAIDRIVPDSGGADAPSFDVFYPDGPALDGRTIDLGIDVLSTGVDTGSTDAPPADGASCGGLTRCGEACVDLQNDPAHCGECGARCCPGNLCVDGRCLSFCSAGQTGCAIDPTCHGGLCRDLRTDSANCGACGHACCPGTVCSAGACVLSCAAVLTTCGESCADLRCVNTQNDPDNCGACGHACCAGTVCSAGHCVFDCTAGLTACGEGCAGGTCADLMTDASNCGACGQVCAAGMHCVRGACGP